MGSLLTSLHKFAMSSRPINFEQVVRTVFSKHGITIGGRQAWDIHVHDPRFFFIVALNPAKGIVESYVNGWWTPTDFPAFFTQIIPEWRLLTKYQKDSKRSNYSLRNVRKKRRCQFNSTKMSSVSIGIKLSVEVLDWAQNHGEIFQTASVEKDKIKAKRDSLGRIKNVRTSICLALKRRKVQFAKPIDNLIDGYSPVIEDLHSMGFQDPIVVKTMIDNLQMSASKSNDAKFHKVWLFFLHAVAGAFQMTEL